MSENHPQQRPVRFSLASLLLVMAALPLWVFLIVAVGTSPGFGPNGFVAAPVALVVATVALSRLFRETKNGLAISALVAGTILTGALVVAAALLRLEG